MNESEDISAEQRITQVLDIRGKKVGPAYIDMLADKATGIINAWREKRKAACLTPEEPKADDV